MFFLFLLTLNIFHSFFSVSIVDFEQESVSWVYDFSVQKKQKLNPSRHLPAQS